MSAGKGTARKLAWLAIGGQILFITSWIVAGAVEPGYSHLDQAISELGADDAENPLIVNAGIVVLGFSVAALGPALLWTLPKRRAALVTAVLFVGSGALIALGGLLPLDCGMAVNERCEDLWRAGELSWQHEVHLWIGLPFDVLFVLTPFALARALWPGPAGAAALVCGAFGLVILASFIGFFAAAGDDGPGGLVQRAGFLVLHAWVVIVAAGILHETRSEQPVGELIPLRPRDFLAQAWSGDGEIVLRPFFLGRRLARRFQARRRSTWISDRVWCIDDEADFGDGRVQRRRMFCEFVADDHVRITAGDLPDGADVWLEEGGIRLSSFRMTFPIGPLPVLLRCYDVSRVEPDGTFVNSTDVRTPGLHVPIARVTFRVRAGPAATP